MTAPVDETIQLRKILAANLSRDSLNAAREGRTAEALGMAADAMELDRDLASPHVIAAKIRFWQGDLNAAQAHLNDAERRGLPRVEAEAARTSIAELRDRTARRAARRAEKARDRQRRTDAIMRALSPLQTTPTARTVAGTTFLLLLAWTLAQSAPHG